MNIAIAVTNPVSPRSYTVTFDVNVPGGIGNVNDIRVNYGADQSYGGSSSGQPTTNPDGSIHCTAGVSSDVLPLHFQCELTDFDGDDFKSDDQQYPPRPVTTVPEGVRISYDILTYIVANCLRGADASPNFTDGEQQATAVDGRFAFYDSYAEDQPDNVLVIRTFNDRKRDEGTPVRDVDVKVLVRAAAGDTYGPVKAAMAAAEALKEFLTTPSLETLTLQALPSGRMVLSFTDPRISPGSLDASGRFEVLVEFGAQYRDAATQS